MDLGIEGKVLVVTGAAQGIGKATAERFLELGAKVVLSDINEDKCLQVLEEFNQISKAVAFFKADVSNEDDVKNMVQFTIDTFGRLDFAVNSAGVVTPPLPMADNDYKLMRRIIDIDLMGVFLCMKYEIPAMLKSGGGSIVNISSLAGSKATKGHSLYTTAKHAVNGLTKSAALDYVKDGIRVNAVCPGSADTDISLEWKARDYDAWAARALTNPMGRLVNPTEVADACIWLCSNLATMINGILLPVDGGRSAS